MFCYFSAYSNGYIPAEARWSYNKAMHEMFVGEDITYVVRYSVFKLGEVRLKILEQKDKNGHAYYKTKAYIDSYPGVPFVDLHQIYESMYDARGYSNFFRATEKEKDYIKYTEYYFNYDKKRIHVKKGKYRPDEVWTDSTAYAKTNYQDGLSLFYYARMNTGQKKSVDVPCFVTEEFVFTRINFHDKTEAIQSDAAGYKIPCSYLNGHTDFVSIFGLTGNFEGYFTNDIYAVPVLAKMKVIIGNVSLELKDWRIGNWKPPRFN